METTTRAVLSPVRRPLIWSHNTSYPGAVGVHSEVGRKAHAIHVTGQRQLSSSLSTIQSIHQKELRSLRHHRKSLESSMLAYTEKMKQISSSRILMSSSARSVSKRGSMNRRNMESNYFERILAANKPAQSRQSHPDMNNARVSVDSGIDVMEEVDIENSKQSSSNKTSFAGKISSTDRQQKHRPASIRSTCSQDSTDRKLSHFADPNQKLKLPTGNDVASVTRRERKAGTVDKPDLFALKLSMQRKEAEKDESLADDPKVLPSDDCSDPTFDAFPFPESSSEQSEVRVDDFGVLITPTVDKDRASGVSSRTSQSSSKKSMKTKENYWSYRKSPRHSLPASSVSHPVTKNSHNDTSSVHPRRASVQPMKKPKAPRPKKTYHHFFRYSDAVDTVIKSLDETTTKSNKVSRHAIRRASEILPALDIQDLRQERQRLKEDAEKSVKEVEEEASSLTDTDRSDESCEDVNENDQPSIVRERSFSAPDILGHLAEDAEESGENDTDEDEEEEKEGESERDAEAGMKSLLKKFDGAYFQNVPPRKTVHFRLPPLDHRAAEQSG